MVGVWRRLARRTHHFADDRVRRSGLLRDYWYPRYEFQMSPRQLCFLANSLAKTRDVDGDIVEIGCAHGLTTTFLYEYMTSSNISKRYHCIDTFDGFTSEDIAVETGERGKSGFDYRKIFRDNHPDWFREALARRNIVDIEVIEADIAALDAGRLPEKISFCLIDVDLYRPVLAALEKVYPKISRGGLIVVDDCWFEDSPAFVPVDVKDIYDGAMQAYLEFIAGLGKEKELVEEKLGVIQKD